MPRGVVLIFIVLIMGSAGLASTAMLARGGLSGLLNANVGAEAIQARTRLFGCLDEALIQLKSDNAYAPATLSTGQATCQLSVTTPGADTRRLTITLTEQSITRRLVADVTLTSFAVTQVIEQ
ncbi:MAG: hypothetical protein UY72_C0011G0011 [Candidatus Uhrbacteria bacterium GW2011_GWD2_52_7]|uniref:Uncharacterized protein n=1 Tax=Candidatus Uhrbacteria bacterium GW2011_GWD2_52_7 TaxID=1618989 RepID=A0A0G2ADG8_9BACT|nr:MAG: hypothetical protein UY72_C0011G0011 [Candidatus Uhrbacteria bacterium GW2011_GWD2_52_7]